jgi:hypothetical protein
VFLPARSDLFGEARPVGASSEIPRDLARCLAMSGRLTQMPGMDYTRASRKTLGGQRDGNGPVDDGHKNSIHSGCALLLWKLGIAMATAATSRRGRQEVRARNVTANFLKRRTGENLRNRRPVKAGYLRTERNSCWSDRLINDLVFLNKKANRNIPWSSGSIIQTSFASFARYRASFFGQSSPGHRTSAAGKRCVDEPAASLPVQLYECGNMGAGATPRLERPFATCCIAMISDDGALWASFFFL